MKRVKYKMKSILYIKCPNYIILFTLLECWIDLHVYVLVIVIMMFDFKVISININLDEGFERNNAIKRYKCSYWYRCRN